MNWRNRLLLLLILAGAATALAVTWRIQAPALREAAASEPVPARAEGAASLSESQGPTERPFLVNAHRYSFDPPRLEVFEGDLVKIELRTLDIAHSFTIDAYRISKRAGPGQPVSFEFRAERAGTFPIYCNLQIDEGCRTMHGELVVKPRP